MSKFYTDKRIALNIGDGKVIAVTYSDGITRINTLYGIVEIADPDSETFKGLSAALAGTENDKPKE